MRGGWTKGTKGKNQALSYDILKDTAVQNLATSLPLKLENCKFMTVWVLELWCCGSASTTGLREIDAWNERNEHLLTWVRHSWTLVRIQVEQLPESVDTLCGLAWECRMPGGYVLEGLFMPTSRVFLHRLFIMCTTKRQVIPEMASCSCAGLREKSSRRFFVEILPEILPGHFLFSLSFLSRKEDRKLFQGYECGSGVKQA